MKYVVIKSQGSVAMTLRCDGLFSSHLIANLFSNFIMVNKVMPNGSYAKVMGNSTVLIF